jgi:hypothetical protein
VASSAEPAAPEAVATKTDQPAVDMEALSNFLADAGQEGIEAILLDDEVRP